MKKVLIALGILSLLGVAGVFVAFMLAGNDIPPPDTTDLIPERIDLPPAQNAYTHFLAATKSLYYPTKSIMGDGYPEKFSIGDDYLAGKPVDIAVIEEVITRNTTTLEAIQRGLECQRCFTPEISGMGATTPYIRPWLNIGTVMAMKTKWDRQAGRHTEATRTCAGMLHFGNSVQHDAEGMVAYLVGISVLHCGLKQARDLACDKGTPPEELTRLSGALAKLGPMDHGLIRAMQVEYRVMANTIDQVRDGTLSVGSRMVSPMVKRKHLLRYMFQPNKTIQKVADDHRIVIRNAPLTYADMKFYESDKEYEMDEGDVMSNLRPNMIGKILYTMTAPSYHKVTAWKCKAECNIAATRLLVACNAYRKAEGRLPDALAVLVPGYLDAIPVDPYDGKPFRYAPAKGIVYSVGLDLTDSGGSTKLPEGTKRYIPDKHRWEAEDVVFEINGQVE